jgi:hypothetical protein
MKRARARERIGMKHLARALGAAVSLALLFGAIGALSVAPVAVEAANTPIFQSGSMRAHNIAKFFTNGLVGDAAPNGVLGDNGGKGVNPFAVTDTGSLGQCFNDASTDGAYHRLCFGHDSSGNALLQVDALGGAAGKGLTVLLNGALIPFPGSLTGMPLVANSSGLQALASTFSAGVLKLGRTTPGDAWPLVYHPSNSACTLNAGAGDGAAQVPTSDGKCWLATFEAAGIDPRHWGMVDSSTADNTAAIQAAINYACSIPSGGKVVLPPLHNFIKTTGTLTLSCGGVSLEGQAQGTTLAPANTGFDTIQMTSTGNAVRHLRIIPAALTGATFAINCVATTDCVVDDVVIANAYHGIHSSGSVSSFRNFKVANISTLGYGLLIDPPPSGDTAATVYNCFMQNSAAATAGILISPGVNAVDISQCDIIKMGTDLSINSAVGKVTTSITVNQSWFDTSGNLGVAVVPAGGQIVRLRFNNVWFGSNPSANFRLLNLGGAGGSIAGLNITNYENYASAGYGFQFDDGLTLNSVRVCNGSNAGNLTAFYIGAGDSDIEICSSEFGAAAGFSTNGTHIAIAAGGGDFIKIHDNTFLAATTTLFFNAATGTHNFIHDNPGYNPLGVAVVTPGASPWTYTAGPTPETHYLNGGTVSSIKLGAAAIFKPPQRPCILDRTNHSR